ncbi:MAG: hypothetical protein IT369_09695 [Candidatus Latescibacteria bacterium]|nr:hypothetical protein [Candidatus Latescibacterota bacterium]
MLHRQLQNALEEIFGSQFVQDALEQSERAQEVIYDRPQDFRQAVLGFQRLSFRDEQQRYAEALEPELGVALICALLDDPTRELVWELGLNYI